MQNKVLRGLAKKGQSLRESFEEMDADGSGELDFEEFVAGIQQLDSRFTEDQVCRLMALIDVDNSGTVDFMELTRGIKHVALIVDGTEFKRFCIELYCAEMRRSREALINFYTNACEQLNDNVVPADKLKHLLKTIGAPWSAEFAGVVCSTPGNARAETFGKGMMEMGFHSLGPFEAFRDNLTKSVEDIRETRSRRMSSMAWKKPAHVAGLGNFLSKAGSGGNVCDRLAASAASRNTAGGAAPPRSLGGLSHASTMMSVTEDEEQGEEGE